ncbi:MAG TPA: PspC domain-containing protein [Bacillota bacterium]|nr:PspC domain-containing protein [Bacillota bacterium]
MILIAVPAVFIILAARSSRSRSNDSYQSGREYRVLCRSRTNRVFAGVCGGIAEYFGWSGTVVRLFFLLSGIGLFTYIILAIAIPDSPSSLL